MGVDQAPTAKGKKAASGLKQAAKKEERARELPEDGQEDGNHSRAE